MRLPTPPPISSTRVPQKGRIDVGNPGVEPRRAAQARQDLAAVGVLDVDLVGEPEARDRPQRLEAVAPVDLLAFLVGPAGIADRDLEDARLALGQLDRQLGLEPEVIRHDRDRLEEIGADGLVARLHVGQVQVGGDVAQERQELVPELVPIEQHAPHLPAGEARPEHGVGLLVDEHLDHAQQIARMVLEVGVVDHAQLAGRLRRARCGWRRPCRHCPRAAGSARSGASRARDGARTPPAPPASRRSTGRRRRSPRPCRGAGCRRAPRAGRAIRRPGTARCRPGRGRRGTSTLASAG